MMTLKLRNYYDIEFTEGIVESKTARITQYLGTMRGKDHVGNF